MQPIKRIHHLTAIVGPPQENYDFYTGVLGLSLLKQTVNFDDTGVYHLYFGDEQASKGFVLTFFPWSNQEAKQGEIGGGQVGTIGFKIPQGQLATWEAYLNDQHIQTTRTNKFNQETLEFKDPHGLSLAVVESEDDYQEGRTILGFYGVELHSRSVRKTKELLESTLHIPTVLERDDAYLLEMIGNEKHKLVLNKEELPLGEIGVGSVHHIAWSIPTQEEQLILREELRDAGFIVTDVKDRNYFQAIYSREKGSILFEYATDEPGFTVDEPLEELGQSLKLPEQYEHLRTKYESELPELTL